MMLADLLKQTEDEEVRTLLKEAFVLGRKLERNLCIQQAEKRGRVFGAQRWVREHVAKELRELPKPNLNH